jgi:hypothetical protein
VTSQFQKMRRPSNRAASFLAGLAAAAGLPAAVLRADPLAPVPQAVPGDRTAQRKRPPLITHNPDGTLTVRTVPPVTATGDGKANKGLAIPPQVIVPVATTPAEKKK